MYRIPDDLDLSPAVGECITQLGVGQFDLQFSIGPVHFAVQSPVELLRDGEQVGMWQEGRWPDPTFYEVMNSRVEGCDVVSDRLIAIEFENGLYMHLTDNSDDHECMTIAFDNGPSLLVI
ncbi:MAG: hypothetical protein R8J94_20760 [Acidimicrobiia bacterium]|nr:hypothetical protein [Acidimicrobiia bacterium]